MEAISRELANRGLALCGHTTDEDVFAELERRGYRTAKPPVGETKFTSRGRVGPEPWMGERETVAPVVEPNATSEDDWLRGWDYLHQASVSTAPYADQLTMVWWAVQNLYVLLEPASARERRLNQ